MDLVGYEMGSMLNFSMPLEWHTFSVVAGQPMLGFVDNRAPPFQLEARTNNFGHFNEFYNSSNNTIGRHRWDAASNPIVDSGQYLSISECSKHPMRSQRATLETHYFPSEGLTIVSDVDDILRIGEVWNPKQIIFNTFVRPFQPWLDMDRVYRD
jgi:hypothetical protein